MSEVKIIAYCGLSCSDCSGFIATRDDDGELREQCAAAWSTPEAPIDPAEINCDGCFAGAPRCLGDTFCKVRECGMARAVINCAYCDDFACDKLRDLWDFIKDAGARARLEGIRKGGVH